MKTLVEGFTKQLQEALDIANTAVLTKKNNIQNIVVTGLGGSGIGGTILSELIQNECPIPIIINKDYFLPKFVDSNSLVIISSYSGNTEETLSAMKQAIDKNAQIVCVTSGGEVHAIADKYKFDTIIIPGGHPPRSCIGYSLVQLIKIVQFNGFVKTDLLNQVQASITLLDKEKEDIKVENLVQTTQTIKLKVTGVGCANDCKDIQKSVTLLNGVASCTLVGKPAANSVFEVTFNPAVVSEKDIRSAVEGTGGCSNPDARPYKVKG